MADDDFDWRDAFGLEHVPSDPNRMWGGSHAGIARDLYRPGDFSRSNRSSLPALERVEDVIQASSGEC